MFAGRADSRVFQPTFQFLAGRLWVPLADEKTMGLSTKLTYMRIELDTWPSIPRLSQYILEKLLGLIIKIRVAKKVTV